MSLWTFQSGGGGAAAGDGAHALVIGVGRYDALQGGAGPLYPQHGGMGQLTSAPVSALAFARWLTTDYRSTTAPLRSLELLVSDTNATAPEFEAGGLRQTVSPANFAAFEQAVHAWFARLDTSERNRAIFYFCGHGIAAGLQTTLLLDDFGTVPNAALGRALDFTVFQRAMDRCHAREQLFVVDACRVGSATLLYAEGYYGDPVLTPGRLPIEPRKAPILYAALPGQTAYGRTNETSYFTEALLQALRGPGAAREGAAWVVLPSSLYRALDRLLEDSAAADHLAQACTIDQLSDFTIHELGGPPAVPVSVQYRPPIDPGGYRLVATSAQASREQLPPLPSPWKLELPTGFYRFSAAPETPATPETPESAGASHPERSCEEIVFPPLTEVMLP